MMRRLTRERQGWPAGCHGVGTTGPSRSAPASSGPARRLSLLAPCRPPLAPCRRDASARRGLNPSVDSAW
ncbi:hypothetical protein FM103_01930 [Corynebacterium xerosis]|nr:hypothetical protein FM103_01930 [Corynebacterium xerosis]